MTHTIQQSFQPPNDPRRPCGSRRPLAALCALMALGAGALAGAPAAGQHAPGIGWDRPGWRVDYLGPLRGHATLSLGAQLWHDYFQVRNLVGRLTLDLAPGVRGHVIVRRREGSWRRMPLHPDLDEAYVEGTAFYHQPDWHAAFNLKGGRVRCLRFPAPDRLAVFDQVPGIGDLYGGPSTDYRGALLTIEAAHRSGLGLHFGGIQWGFDAPREGANAVEWYGFYRRDLRGGWAVEGRAGALAGRTPPLGGPARRGANLFVGAQLGEFEVGGMLERRRGEGTYTGVMVRFRPTPVTRALGAVGFDYTRQREGLVVQYDLARLRIGQSTEPAPGEELVGEIRAVRLRTYWQQGFQRNEYEHRLSAWGKAGGPRTRCVVKEEPWTLELEALVSPHVSLSREWFRDRQGPAQLARVVTYQFYRRRDEP